MSHVTIREMEIDDLAPVYHLGEQLFQPEELSTLYRTWDDREVIELFMGEPELCLVALAECCLVGFALGTTITKRRSAWKYGHLVWMGVAPEAQRRGLAGRLVRAQRERMIAAGIRIVLVDTEADNLPALAFFAKQGFGHSRQHTYLTLNLDRDRLVRKEARK